MKATIKKVNNSAERNPQIISIMWDEDPFSNEVLLELSRNAADNMYLFSVRGTYPADKLMKALDIANCNQDIIRAIMTGRHDFEFGPLKHVPVLQNLQNNNLKYAYVENVKNAKGTPC